MIARTAALAAALALLSAGAAQAQVSKGFREWRVICDNTRVCAAFGFSREPSAAYLRIERQPGPGGRLRADVGLVSFEGDGKGAWAIKADGKVVPGLGAVAFQSGEWSMTLTLEGEQARRLVSAARDAGSLTIEHPGVTPIAIVLTGSSASLRFIDEQQGRVGLTDALAAVGPKSPATAPPAPAPPVIRVPAGPAQARLPARPPGTVGQMAGEDVCDQPGEVDVKVRLGPDLMLWGGLCSSGAYNALYRFFTADDRGGHLKALSFPYASGTGGPAATDDVVNPQIDAETLTITAFEKGRGPGDCGELVTWVWTGKAFVLARQDTMPDCQGVPAEQWPTLFRATIDQAGG
jgi:hypothetical protein